MRGISQVLPVFYPRKGPFSNKGPKILKEHEDDASQLNRLCFYFKQGFNQLFLASSRRAACQKRLLLL